MIRLEAVAKRYGTGPEVLCDIDLEVEPGSFHFLTGPSGAGKSTLLRLLYLEVAPTRGRITMMGRDVAAVPRPERPALRRRIGVVFQEFRLIEHLSAFDNVALPLRMAGETETKVKEYVTDLLDWVGLAGHLDALPTTLSGGQQQRVAIARAVIARPNLLVADEPTGNVDSALAIRLIGLFDEMHRLGTTVVIATHNEELIERFGHPVLALDEGRLTRHPRRA